MQITFLGHASLLISTGGKKLLVDPFISGNERARDIIKIEDLNPDYILITHAHNDHTQDVNEIAGRSGAIVISNFEIATYYGDMGLKVHSMNHGGSWTFDFGTLKYVNAIHSSSFPDGSYGGQPGGYVISSLGKHLYVAGDTALTMEMKLIPLFAKLDLAILPIGDNFTMGPSDAVIASDFIGCNRVMGYHYDTFGYIEIDHHKARKIFSDAGKELILLGIGESLEV